MQLRTDFLLKITENTPKDSSSNKAMTMPNAVDKEGSVDDVVVG